MEYLNRFQDLSRVEYQTDRRLFASANRDLILRVTYRYLHRDYSPGDNKGAPCHRRAKTICAARDRFFFFTHALCVLPRAARSARWICIRTWDVSSRKRTWRRNEVPRSCDVSITLEKGSSHCDIEDVFSDTERIAQLGRKKNNRKFMRTLFFRSVFLSVETFKISSKEHKNINLYKKFFLYDI